MSRSDIDHYEGLEIWNPASMEALRALLAPLPLERGLRVVDVGCGRAAPLIDLAEQLDARVTGVDRSRAALDLARAECAKSAPEADATWLESDMNDVTFDDAVFDLILALGGPYRTDSLEKTFRLYGSWLKQDGHLLHGDGYWAQDPPEPYLEATGLPRDALPLGRDAYLDIARGCGLESDSHWIASRDDWDHFEGTILHNHEAYAREHAGDPGVDEMIARKRAWDDAQQRWGRDTMVFCVDVFRLRG